MADSKMAAMRKKFQQLDADKNGYLSFDELAAMLKAGNKSFTEEEAQALYDACDSNKDGKIEFDEFLDFIYKGNHSQERTSGGRQKETESDRHQRLAASSGPADDGTEVDWAPCCSVFTDFAGKDMDGREFMKFCKDTKLIGSGYTKTDVDIVFSKVVPKGKRRMDFANFKDACRIIAGKRRCKNCDVQSLVSDSSGPKLVGTQAEATRFHDDKANYTGTHSHNDKITGVDPNAALGRHEKLVAQQKAAMDDLEEDEDSWDEVSHVFKAFAGASGDLDGKEFNDMCISIKGLQRGAFQTGDIAVIFSSVCPRGLRRIQFEHFQDAVRKIAVKKDEAVHVTQACIARSKGPTLHNVTKAEYNKFHDDKNLYTGAQAM